MNDDKIISFADNKLVIKKEEEIKWAKFTVDSKGNKTILKVWQNLESVLNYHNLKPRLNQISKEIEWNNGKFEKLSLDSILMDVKSLQIQEGLNMGKDDIFGSVRRISENNKFNKFLDILKENENQDESILNELLGCIEINKEFTEHKDFYIKMIIKWFLNVVKMTQNTLERKDISQGILILQGAQGTFKSTFFRQLFPDELKDLFLGEATVDTDNKDSIIIATSYIVSELAEMDGMFKQDQAKLKRFVTCPIDQYRAPYAVSSQKHARTTTFCGTVNNGDFLKDETGSRRYWVVPISKIDAGKQKSIDMIKFWGFIFYLYKTNKIRDYLNDDEQNYLTEINRPFNAESDVSILLKEKLDFDSDKSTWQVRQLKDLSVLIDMKGTKQIKNELLKMGIKYKVHKIKGVTQVKKGVLVPRFDLQQC